MAINLGDYERTAAQRGWGAGWPSCNGAKSAGTAIVTARRSGTRMSVHKRIARLVQLLIDETERRGYLLVPGQCGAYNCRPISGTSSPSNHSWALAIDINWLRNPMRRPLTTDLPPWLVALWERFGFAWGGRYTSTPDPMHLEFMGTPADADQMTALALRELGTPAPPIEEDFMATMTEADKQLLLDGARSVLRGYAGVRDAGDLYRAVDGMGNTLSAQLTSARNEIAALHQLLSDLGVDPAAVKTAVESALRDGVVRVEVQIVPSTTS